MALWNTRTGYGWPAILFHWLVAVVAAGLFISGLWMTGLSYYDPWYNEAPSIHRAFGVLLFLVVVLRLGWRLSNPRPRPEPGTRSWEHRLSLVVQWLMYGLLLAIMAAGYVMSTVDGRAVDVFGWFSVPPVYTGGDNLEDLAGAIHYWLAMVLAACVGLHSAGALKHHLLDRNRTLVRMLRPNHNPDGRHS